MRPLSRFALKSLGATQLLLAVLLFALIPMSAPARAADDVIEAPLDDIEPPAQVAPDDAEAPASDDVVEPDELAPDAAMRPDVKQGSEGAPPPQSAQESKRDKLDPPIGDLPLQSPIDRPKVLAQLYEQLGKVADAEAAAPIMEAIQRIWRLSGSDTVDLLMARAERFTKEDDLDLAQKIIDAAVDMAPDQAEAWDLRAKINFLKKDYDAATADLKRALDRDPKHYDAMNDLGVVYEAMGSKKEALEAYRKALAVNPYLSEPKRAVEELRRAIEGQDI
jgi:tetratricopeptide (TPR) repeat protein